MGLSYCKESTTIDKRPISRPYNTNPANKENKQLLALVNKNAPTSRMREYGFYLMENLEDFFHLKQLGLLVFITGSWHRYEFAPRVTAPAPVNKKSFACQKLSYYNPNNMSMDLGNGMFDKDVEASIRDSYLSEISKENSNEAAILVYSLKRRKIVSKFSKFSFGFSFYSRVRYCHMLKGFLLIEVNLSLYLLTLSGRRLIKINFGLDKDIDTRCFEVMDSLRLIAVGTKAHSIKFFTLDESQRHKTNRNSALILTLKHVQTLYLPTGDNAIHFSSLNYSESSKMLAINERGGPVHFYKWTVDASGRGSFIPVLAQMYNLVGTLVPFEFQSDKRHYSFYGTIKNREVWTFEDRNCFYVFKLDISPAEVFIWETSRLKERNQLRLAARIDWERLYKMDDKKGWAYIEETIKSVILLGPEELRVLTLLALFVLRFPKHLEVFDILPRTQDKVGYELLSVIVRNGKHLCKLSMV